MTTADLVRHRLFNQHLTSPRRQEPHEVVTWLGAMQAQEYAMAKWAIGLRLPGATHAAIEHALDAGTILRTHVLRPTWHFVAPADIRWLLALTAPRVRAKMAIMDRAHGVEARLLKRSHAVILRALHGGHTLTRAELQLALRRAHITADGVRLVHVLMHAELDGLICSGPRRGKQSTYALLDERVPATKPLTRDAALAALAQRYFQSRGPATARDFAWWSGLTVRDAKAGIAALGTGFAHETLDGETYVFPTTPLPRTTARGATFLLPDYDEYGIAYADRSALMRPTNPIPAYNRLVVIDGQAEGSWKRTETRAGLAIELVPFATWTAPQRAAVTRATARLGTFLGLSVTLTGR